MKILINTTNLYVGGGVQVALSFLNEIKKISEKNIFYILVSKVIANQLNVNEFGNNFSFHLIETSPSSLKTRNKVVKQLDELENKIKPNIVFTVFGPSYWRPKSVHIIGFADGWVYNPDTVAYKKLSLFNKIKMKLKCEYKKFYLKHDADFYVLETEDAKYKFSKILRIDLDKISVVGNTYSEIFNDKEFISKNNKFYIKLPKKNENEFRFMYIAHNHPAKNIKIIDEIIPLLSKNIKFVLTIDENSFNTIFTNKDRIINLGSIDINSCPSVYEQCDALFAPTLLETFSAAYPEAMKMKVPILTSEYSFAKDICKDAALYFNPLDIKDIVDKIYFLVKNKNIQNSLIKNGMERLKNFETSKSRALKYIELCENIVKLNKI